MHILGDIILRICPFLESAIAWEIASLRQPIPILERDLLKTTQHHLSLAHLLFQSLSPALSLPNSQQGRTERAAPVGIQVHPAFSLMGNVGKLSCTKKNIGKDGDSRDATHNFSKAIFVNCKMSKCVVLVLTVAHSQVSPGWGASVASGNRKPSALQTSSFQQTMTKLYSPLDSPRVFLSHV